MSSRVSRAIQKRGRVIRRIYWRMSFKIMGGIYGAIGLATLAVSEFGTDSVQHELLFRVLIHHVPTWAWPAAALLIVVIAGVEGGVEDDRRLDSMEERLQVAQRASRNNLASETLLKIEQQRQHEEMRPQLEARIVEQPTGTPGRSHRLEVRIKSPQPLISIMAFLPSDPRTGLVRHELEAPRPGNAIFHPGMWINVGGVSYTRKPECEDDLVIRFRCRNEERIRWDDIPVAVALPKVGLHPLVFRSDS